MNLEIELSELRKRKLMIATPMYGGNCHGMYAKSCADLSKLCANYEIDLKIFYLFTNYSEPGINIGPEKESKITIFNE